MSVCQVCGCVYHWQMFFHNHLRDVHGIATARNKQRRLKKKAIKFLTDYCKDISSKPTLDEIEELANVLGVKKESVYWWFVNYNKNIKARARKLSVSVKQDVKRKRRVGRIPPGTVKGSKRGGKKAE